jgi:predicted unusual protein kinase regulating ubiquinone biosynthesis (AarF/ABC1/UbiB family)
MKRIKTNRWQRQWHMTSAGLRAGLGLAGGHLRTLGLSGDALQEARDQLMFEQASAWVAELGELKGTVVKMGQILATYADYCLPQPIAQALHQLESETQPLAWSAILPQLEQVLGNQLTELIVDSAPLAAASLAQVHRARVKADNRALCLKILYPGVIDTLDSDLAVLATGLRWLLHGEQQHHFEQWLVVIRQVLEEELDLVLEAGKLERWAQRLSHDQRYIVPTVAQEFSSSAILAMRFESGVVQHDASVFALSQSRRNALAVAMLELLLREVLVWGEMQTDPHPGNYRIRIQEDEKDQLVLLDFGSVRPIATNLLQPLRQMVLAAWQRDPAQFLAGIFAAGLLKRTAPLDVQEAFSNVLMGLMEPLYYRNEEGVITEGVPDFAVDQDGHYCWAQARLPKRMGKQALQSAFSKHFAFPGADFMLLSRKLAGVYAFIAALDARFDGGEVMRRVVQEMPTPVQEYKA